ncbi:MAG: N-acetyltransferase family protein [Halohasta sp.]
MTTDRRYPEAVSGPFETPPVEFLDREGREIEIRPYDGTDAEYEALVEMYTAFDPADRAQGIPPGRESRVRTWLDGILADDCHNVIAWDDETAAGHSTLVPDGDDDYELAIFVLQDYQQAGIGTHLIESLLGYGVDNDIRKVWLTVERWNHPAVSLYKKVGFETTGAESFELEMAIRLGADD